jgi:hypothetical protein
MASPDCPPALEPTFWRIKNIRLAERDTALKWLHEHAILILETGAQGFSLVADGKNTLCATLTAGKERPILPNLSWLVDKEFIGFTPVYDPDDANVDIIAVTGLGGHALGSFRSTNKASVWLRDFAPEDIPRARIITYGYNTAVVASDNKQGVSQLAQTLSDGLRGFRKRTQTQHRPMIFFCHSLGGVVLKEALVYSSKAIEDEERELREVTTLTYGLMFMGVPNLGLQHKELATMVKGQANEEFIRNLLLTDGQPSQFLDSLTKEFLRLDKRRNLSFKIVSYYETRKSPTVEVSMAGGTLKQLRYDHTD